MTPATMAASPTSVHRPNAFLSTVENSDPGPFQVESARRGLQEAVDAATAAEAEMATRRQAHAEGQTHRRRQPAPI